MQTEHKSLAQGTDGIKRYPVNLLQVLGCALPAAANLNELDPWVCVGEKLFMVGDLALLPANWSLVRQVQGVQMVYLPQTPVTINHVIEQVRLTEADYAEMLELVLLVQPGYYCADTPKMGDYFGIKVNNQLVAMAGERFRITGYSEISAVVTHPDFVGRGFARQLVGNLTNKIIAEKNLPFLHLVATNQRAMDIYISLGYTKRRLMNFTEITRHGV